MKESEKNETHKTPSEPTPFCERLTVMVVVPMHESCQAEANASIVPFCMVNAERYNLNYLAVKAMPIAAARNFAVQSALDSKVDYVLFIDSDMISHPDFLPKLLSHNKDVITGLCFRKTPPFLPTVYKATNGILKSIPIKDIPKKGIIEIDACGAAFLLVNTRVFKVVESPWFDSRGGLGSGEDINFCKKVKAAKIDIWVDPEVEVGHIGAISNRALHEAFINAYSQNET